MSMYRSKHILLYAHECVMCLVSNGEREKEVEKEEEWGVGVGGFLTRGRDFPTGMCIHITLQQTFSVCLTHTHTCDCNISPQSHREKAIHHFLQRQQLMKHP